VYGAVALVVNIAEGGSDEGISALHKAIQVGPQEPEAQGPEQYLADPVEDVEATQDFTSLWQGGLALAKDIGPHANDVVADVSLPVHLTHRGVEEVLIQGVQLTAHFLEPLVAELPVFRRVVLQQLQTHRYLALDI